MPPTPIGWCPPVAPVPTRHDLAELCLEHGRDTLAEDEDPAAQQLRGDGERVTLPDLVCRDCGAVVGVATLAWRCDCGGVFDVTAVPGSLHLRAEQEGRNSLWRYESVLPVPFADHISLGEGMSSMVRSKVRANIRFKLDFLMPTLSFKDRGAVVLATLAQRLGVSSALTDSSGNAGTAAAAYLARAGIPCRIYVPEATSAVKLAQMRAHGAEVVAVAGSRAAAAGAARDAAAEPGVFYASHVYHPYFLHGVKTYGYEVWEQGGRQVPDTVVVPVGNGTLLLGCFLAFGELLAAGLATRLPRLVAVQSKGCAPVAQAFDNGLFTVPAVTGLRTVAEGIAIESPPRGAQILAAIRASGGAVVTVGDDEIRSARAELAAEGLYVEPTSAVCWAAVRSGAVADTEDAVVPLCGAGAKSAG